MRERRETAHLGLPPFPEGWYLIARRSEILRSGLLHRTCLGRDVVVWCDDEGQVCVADDYCPHTGTRLGPQDGGRVIDGRLVSPRHGWEFDTSGQCVGTPVSQGPRSAQLKVFETHEIQGMIFAWYGHGGRPAQWRLPANPAGGRAWSRVRFRTFRFSGHPQEITENSVDLAHLRYVHGYDSVAQIGDVSVDGPRLESCFKFKHTRKLGRWIRIDAEATAVTHLHGLGYSFVEIAEYSISFSARLWVLATPLDGTEVDLVMASQVKLGNRPVAAAAFRIFLKPLQAELINRWLLMEMAQDLRQDVVIWRRKRFAVRPRLVESDGEILAFRRYCEQFYPGTHTQSENG